MSSNMEIEPGAAPESILVASDSVENLNHMNASLEELRNDIKGNKDETNLDNTNIDNLDDVNNDVEKLSVNVENEEEEECIDSNDWTNKDKHVFVLSLAGKPIYSRYGSEDMLAWLFGVMQILVSFVQTNDDTIKSIHAGTTNFVFFVKKPLILVAVSKTKESVNQLTLQLNYVFNQIVSELTSTRLNKIYEQRQNYDLRRLLSGVERLVDHLLTFSESEPAFMLGAIQCLPLPSVVRDNISSAIIGACNKIKNLVFAILLANNKLITLVQMKKYRLHPADLHIIFNLVQASESLKTAESWTPLCLPRFDPSSFLYGHVSYLAEDCQACLLLLTVERDMFFTLSEAKQRIVEKLRRSNCLEAINLSLNSEDESCTTMGEFPRPRHYLYKCKSTVQFYQPRLDPPYNIHPEVLLETYKRMHQSLHATTRRLKLIVHKTADMTVFAWDTKGFELYAIYEPLIDAGSITGSIKVLLNWIKKKEDRLFHLNAPTF